jgi:anti-sigma-K factor RskA
MNPTLTSTDLDWLAQQYVLGDLPAGDAARFEARLADDPAACEAVAQATRLMLALETVEWAVPTTTNIVVPTKELVGTAHPTKKSPLVAAAAVAACALVIALSWSPVRSPSSDLQVRAEIVQAKELVSRWRGSRALVAALTTSDEDDVIADTGDLAPSWMLAAVSIEKQKPTNPAAENGKVWEDN